MVTQRLSNCCWIIKLILIYIVKESPLYYASYNGHTEIVELLLNSKADPNICCEGKSPLYYASYNGHTEIVELLLYIRISFIIQQQFNNLCDLDQKRCIMETFLHNIY
jgi:ankyrin repeat protein